MQIPDMPTQQNIPKPVPNISPQQAPDAPIKQAPNDSTQQSIPPEQAPDTPTQQSIPPEQVPEIPTQQNIQAPQQDPNTSDQQVSEVPTQQNIPMPHPLFTLPQRDISARSAPGLISMSPSEVKKARPSRQRFWTTILLVTICVLLVAISVVAIPFLRTYGTSDDSDTNDASLLQQAALPQATPTPTPRPFDPAQGAVLPDHRVVAFYAVPDAEPTGPAYNPTPQMLKALQAQGQAYQQLDPDHPVMLGIDLVVSVPDNYPGDQGTYSHHVDPATIQNYLDFCKQNNLLLFLDLNIGQANIQQEVNFFLPYLEQNSFVDMALDPEWMFPRHDGIPGVNLSNVRASDLNPVISTLAALPMKYHVPRKVLIIHQYRPDGDGSTDPDNAAQAEIADKRDLLNDSRVDVVIHVDSVGGFVGDHETKTSQYEQWVRDDMARYKNFKYGGFKLFYHLEAKTGLMTPKEVMSLDPPPMVITYGN